MQSPVRKYYAITRLRDAADREAGDDETDRIQIGRLEVCANKHGREGKQRVVLMLQSG